MFLYHVAARQMYNQTVASLAVLCDENPVWRPRTFAYETWGCGVAFTFRIAKLLDWARNLDGLEADRNPFAAIVLAHLHTQRTRDDPDARKAVKLRLVKGLYHRGLDAEDVRQLFRLLDWMLTLPEEFEDDFWRALNEFEVEEKMEYITSVERIGMRKGFEKGQEQGCAQGLEQGLRKGLLESVALDLQGRFGASGTKLLRKARALDITGLRRLVRLVKKAKSLDDVRAFFS